MKKADLKKGYIYKLYWPGNPRVYIGQSIDVDFRVNKHTDLLLLGKHPNSEWQKDFDNGLCNDTMVEVSQSDDLNTDERKLIALNIDNCYNVVGAQRLIKSNRMITYQAVLTEEEHAEICNNYGYGMLRGSFSQGVRTVLQRHKSLIDQYETTAQKLRDLNQEK